MGAQRRSVPAGGDVTVGGVDGVEQVGDRNGGANGVGVDEGDRRHRWMSLASGPLSRFGRDR